MTNHLYYGDNLQVLREHIATEKAIVSVKGGANVGLAMVKDLIATVDREKAKIGVFVTLAEPTKPMEREAVTAGFYQTDYGKFPKIQILIIEDLFAGKKPRMPWLDPAAFKKSGEGRYECEEAGKSDLRCFAIPPPARLLSR
ncbi:MAG: hypothetical protein V9H25_08280 [Candidatus Competibacter sp.]